MRESIIFLNKNSTKDFNGFDGFDGLICVISVKNFVRQKTIKYKQYCHLPIPNRRNHAADGVRD